MSKATLEDLRVLSVIPPMTQLNTPYPSTAYLTGFLRSRHIDAAQEEGISVNQLILYAVWTYIRSKQGIPLPGSSQFARNTPEDYLKAYLSGETLLMPCGKPKCKMVPVALSGMEFCDTCNVRIG